MFLNTKKGFIYEHMTRGDEARGLKNPFQPYTLTVTSLAIRPKQTVVNWRIVG